VKDVRPLPGYGSAPGRFTAVAGAVYFTASDEANGEEVWRTDGTASGTRLLKDAVPGRGSFPADLTEFDGALFFSAGGGLWRSNGTSLGTQLFRADLTSAYELAVHGGALYFAANDGVHGSLKWESLDGLTAWLKRWYSARAPTAGGERRPGTPDREPAERDAVPAPKRKRSAKARRSSSKRMADERA
jgi:trimeric autotransporter adhesin